jgi:hypothetical protein
MEDIKNILNEIVRDYGLKIFEDPQKFKAVFADYAKGENSTERDLFTKIIENDAAKEIKNADDISEIKKVLVKKLHDKYSIDEKTCADCIDLFIIILRNDYKINNIKAKETGENDINKTKKTKNIQTEKEIFCSNYSNSDNKAETKNIGNTLEHCLKCNAIIKQNEVFCENCGYKKINISISYGETVNEYSLDEISFSCPKEYTFIYLNNYNRKIVNQFSPIISNSDDYIYFFGTRSKINSPSFITISRVVYNTPINLLEYINNFSNRISEGKRSNPCESKFKGIDCISVNIKNHWWYGGVPGTIIAFKNNNIIYSIQKNYLFKKEAMEILNNDYIIIEKSFKIKDRI